MSTKGSARKAPSKTKPVAVDLTLSDSDNDEDVSMRAAGKAKSSMKAKATTTSNGKRKHDDTPSDSDEEEDVKQPAKKRVSTGGASVTAARKKSTKIESDDDDEYNDDNVKGKQADDDEDEDMGDLDDEEEEEDVKPKKKAPAAKSAPKKASTSTPASSSKPKASTSKAKVEDGEEEPKKFKWQPKERAGPSNPGAKPIPEGAPDCLGGLTIVFTGELETIGRDEATTLAKRYGAKVTTSVSSKTSYVVLGLDAGPSKLKMIEKNKIKTLDEDGFLKLIETRGAKDLDKKYLEKQKEDEKKIRQAAKAIEIDPKLSKEALWTVKYAPQNLKELCGNSGMVEKLRQWLEAWPKNLAGGFKKPGKDGWGCYRAFLIGGPPGIGKTTAAHLVAKLEGYKVIEMNASDTRSKKLLESQLRSSVDNTVLDGFMIGKQQKSADSHDRSVLIMDEVDGTSAGDRGGIGALNALIKKTKIPIICIANDTGLQKMKPLLATTFLLKFKRPEAAMIRSRLMTIAFKENMKIDKTVADQLVSGTQSDIRQIINLLSTWKLGNQALTFDETKKLTSQRDSNALSTPFTLMEKLFSPYAWSQTSGARVNEKLEIYFHEFDLLPLFVQENYLKHKYARAQGMGGRQAAFKKMEITSKAADCISDGDMIDRMIHGTQQHWTLMPVHGMMSTVMPSYWTYGQGSFGNNGDSMGSTKQFPGWFGKNSTQGRLQRLLTDIQIRMRLKVSGDKREIRQSYIPVLLRRLTEPLLERGNDGIEDVIREMDEYYLTKEEWDAVVELGVGENTPDPILKQIKPATKTAFTRKYNGTDHPIPFHKGTDIATSKRVARDTERPDLEEAFEVEVEEADDEEKKPKKGEDEDTIKDKLVKAKKPKATKAAPAKAKAPAKPKATKK